MMRNVAVLGTGLMGAPIARNLARAGFSTRAWNRSPEKAAPLSADGVTVSASAQDCVAQAQAIIVMLSDGPTCDGLLFGEDGVAPALPRDAIVVMMSSIPPLTARRQADRLAPLGVGYVDAPVSGGEIGAVKGNLTIFAGGGSADLSIVTPVLEVLGRVNVVGGVGSGQLVKLANQMLVGVTLEAVAEALLLIERGGGDAAAAFAALQGGFADSTVLRVHGQRMLREDHAPGGTVATQLKDLRMGTEMADGLNLRLPLLALTESLFETAAAGPDRSLDHSAIHRTLRAAQTTEGIREHGDRA